MKAKRFGLAMIFTLAIVALYQLVDINLFTIDLPRRVNSGLFPTFRENPSMDTTVILLDIDAIDLDSMAVSLKILESYEPRIIGLNICNVSGSSARLDQFLKESKLVVNCDCTSGSPRGSSMVKTPEDEVKQFSTESDLFFEQRLAVKSNLLAQRSNSLERINFRDSRYYVKLSLGELDKFMPVFAKDKTFLVGSLRDSLITPMNKWYGKPGVKPADMSPIEISENIVLTINNEEFINDVSFPIRVLIILAVTLICIMLIWLVRTKYNVINVILALVIFVVINTFSTFFIVYAFKEGYYLELNEMTAELILAAIVSVYWNARDIKKKNQATSQ